MAFKELVFSPTGGTKKAADMFMGGWSDVIDVVDLSAPAFKASNIAIDGDDAVLIAMPDFAGRAPAVAIERLKGIQGNGASCVVMIVYGNRAFEDGLVEMADAATEAGFVVVAGIAAIAQHSIMPQYAKGRPNAADRQRLREFATVTKTLVAKGENAIDAIPGNRPYKKAGSTTLVPAVNNKHCTKCGMCATSCPVSAINPTTFKAHKKTCIECMRCIDVCPVQARTINWVMVRIASLAIKKEASVKKEAELYS